MAELVMEENINPLTTDERVGKGRVRKEYRKLESVEHIFNADGTCEVVMAACNPKKNFCNHCFMVDLAARKQSDGRVAQLEKALQDAQKETEAVKLQLKVYDSMKAIMARAGREIIEQEVNDGQTQRTV